MAEILGTGSRDIIQGTANDDAIQSLQGDDLVYGLGGNDLINGGDGNDDLYGEAAFYQGNYYLLSNPLSWQDAQNEALSLGGNLVTVNDASENQFLADTFGNEGDLWIGFTDQNVEGQFEWISGEAVTYTNWFPGQPDNFNGNENYAAINYINPGQWNDAPTEFGYRGIIEISSGAILAGNDTLNGEEGDDRLFGGFGNDILDGGIGSDTADYSTLSEAITLLPTGVVNKGTAGTDQLITVETIIGAVGQNNVIDASSATGSASINVDLANQNVTVNGLPFSLSFSVENFVNVIGTAQNDIISGDGANNQLSGNDGDDTVSGNDGDDTFVGSQGDDTLDGGAGSDTLDYSNFSEAITLLGRGFVDKGSAGIETISNIETIIGAVGQANTIDASNGLSGTTFLDANLGANSLIINGLPGPVSSLSFTVQNFVNVTGTTQADNLTGNNLANKIVGNSGDDLLFGEQGNDTLRGNSGDDFLFGGEGNDVLQGGANNDTLVLALGNGNDRIIDFQLGLDKFGLAGGLTFDQLSILSTSTNTLIRNGSDTLATVLNVNSTSITSADFIIV